MMYEGGLISKAAAKKAMHDKIGSALTVVRMWHILDTVPAVDAVPVVRCKDCKHRPVDHRDEYNEVTGFSIEFPDNCCPCQCEDGWYNWYPQDDWFCANGERRDGDATD